MISKPAGAGFVSNTIIYLYDLYDTYIFNRNQTKKTTSILAAYFKKALILAVI